MTLFDRPVEHGVQGEPATTPTLVHETLDGVPSAQAKRYLLDAFESRGWDPLQARAKAIELWGTRKSEPIEHDALSELIGKALDQQGPNDDSYQHPAE